MGGVWIVAVFLAAVFSYLCTEYQLVSFQTRLRIMVGAPYTLLMILLINAASFLITWMSALAFVIASRSDCYVEVTAICAGVQAMWLGQNLWVYHRDRARCGDALFG
ncbi:MAG TPA: hypothetical protein VH684_24965 [Xanthobacteraceae bacterium]